MIESALVWYAALGACALVTAQAVRRYDLHAREPWWALCIALGLGACGMFLAGAAQSVVVRAIGFSADWQGWMGLAARAGVSEELAKFGATGLMVLIARRHFDESVDGLIYGAFVGLGAAMEESVNIVVRAGPVLREHGVSMFPPAEIVRLAGHLVMGGIGGFGWGAMVARWRGWPVWMAWCLVGAILLHGLWDVAAFDAMLRKNGNRSGLWIDATAAIGLMLGGLIAFRWLVSVGVTRDGNRGAMKESEAA